MTDDTIHHSRQSSIQNSGKRDYDRYYDSSHMPCQMSVKGEEGEREKTIESQLEYSADKMFNSNKSSARKEEKILSCKNELKDLHQQLVDQQNLISHVKYLRKPQSHNSQHTSSSQFQDEKQHTDFSQPHDGRYNMDCEVSDIKKVSQQFDFVENLSINQDLSLLNCERVLATSVEEVVPAAEAKIHVLIQENLKLSKLNETLHHETENLRNVRQSSRLRTDSREIMLKNHQIAELQRRVFEAESEQIQRQSEGLANNQCLERKVHSLTEQNSILLRQAERYKLELHQSQLQLHTISEQNTQLQTQVIQLQDQLKCQQWMDSDQEEYQRLKCEFEEFQRLTQNIINQDEECQRRLCEQEEEIQQQGIIQEELVAQLREADDVFQHRLHEMKEQFQNEFDQSVRRLQEQNQNLREQNQYLFDQLQAYELEKQNIEEYFLGEIETIKGQCNQKCVSLEQQLKLVYDKQLQDKNSLISQLQEQIRYNNDLSNETVIRSKSLSACGGINKLAGMIPSSKNGAHNYYLPPYRANISLEEEQYGRVKQNNSFHNSNHNTNNPQNNNSFNYQKKVSQPSTQNFTKNILVQHQRSNQKCDKENLREWEKSALILSQKKQKDQLYQDFREQYTKQKNNLYLRQLDGEFKYSPHVPVPDTRSNNTNVTNQRYSNMYKNTYQNDSRTSLSNGPPKNPAKKQ